MITYFSLKIEDVHGGKEWTSYNKSFWPSDGKSQVDSEIWYLNWSQDHPFFLNEFTVLAKPFGTEPLPPRSSREEPNQNAGFGLGQSSEGVNAADIGHIGLTDQEETNCTVHQAENSSADAIADDSALSNSQRREVAQVLKVGTCGSFTVIVQETDTREIGNLPAPALPAIISSRSSEGHSQTTGSKFAPRPSADLPRQRDYSPTTDLCPNRSTDHHSSACLQEYNDTKKDIAPSETGSALEASLWDAPRTPGIFNIREIDHYTQQEVAALKEEAERNSGGGNQAPENNEAAPAVPSEEGHKTTGNTKSEQSQKDPQKIKREHRELRDVTLCKICMENTISVVFLPCGHLVTCPDCAPAMRKCPICRTLIKGIVKTFYG